MVDGKKLTAVLMQISHKMTEQKDYLTRLDAAIGDSDHGINMARGFEAVEKKLPSLADKDIGTILKTVGMTLVSTVGGASGPLYGSAFMKAGVAMAGKEDMDLSDFLEAMRTGVEAVQMRGRAGAGEKTMLDSMLPAMDAMEEEASANAQIHTVLKAGVIAAWDGVEGTKDMIATKGRASYLGERSVGHQDPGATSFAYMLETIASMF
ncbi:dihydroxyacetone kinase subunit DhaL [Diplocloster agilis]|uniref:phosphoenolpyruvate--glycerone phosphotransferase n=1 Tax=Diplocloster agilis TaxID=2850323 RepID=A0A949NE03_9FIRM|nr:MULTISPECIES: dihydroxyacetone kinase subunit DhaL [Lachnospiraceae]MBU9735769.1 dihydroxyacetone kinase subunit L [Diplocloster agilis]MCU6736703.1 dihydroxyacetone kinase subunit DhaL [Suonthocola fibrivorans]SCJ92999.1 PTS-dependent dihydroxyacetone kinase%2C ADP-binding subunit dhaL [uncultured Clostridium sp.]